MRLTGIVLGSALVAVAAPGTAHAAHPCGIGAPDVRAIGTLVAGDLERLRYSGVSPLLVDWGDGTRSRPVLRGNRIRHRFRRAGRLTLRVTTSNGECCDSSHTDCGPMPNLVTTVKVSVRRPR